MSSQNFEDNIKKWVSLDNQMRLLNEKLREVREQKARLMEPLLEHAQENQNLNSTIQISDGKLKFAKTRVSEPLTFKYLEKSLSEIIHNPAQVKQIVDHVKQNREIKIVQEIKRFS